MKHGFWKKVLPLMLVAAVLLGSSAAYAAAGSSTLGANAGVYVNSSGDVVIDEANVEVAGSVTAENGKITLEGVKMEYREIGDWGTGSSGSSDEASDEASEEASEEASDEAASGEASGSASGESSSSTSSGSLQTGQSGAILAAGTAGEVTVGGKEDHFTAYDGQEYNTVIELWADDADVDNALYDGVKRSPLTNNVETYPGIGLEATGASVTIDNVYVLTQGANRSALCNSDGMMSGGTTVVRDSTFVSLCDGWIFPAHICLLRGARTALLTSAGDSYFYNTSIFSDSWGSYSMEAANGIDNFVIVNGYAECYKGGYGIFTLGMTPELGYEPNIVRIYGTKMLSPQYAWICDDGSNITIASMADVSDEDMANYDGEITPDMYQTEDGVSFFAGNNNAAVITFDMLADPILTNTIRIKDAVFTTAAEDLIRADGTACENVMDYYGDSILNNDEIMGGMAFFATGYVKGATFWQRGSNADITMENVDLRSSTGVVFHSTIDYTNFTAGANMDGKECLGIQYRLTDMDVKGDFIHEDYQRKLYLTLDGTSLEGAVNWYTVEQYADNVAAYVDSRWAEAEEMKAAWEAENGAGSSLMGSKEDIIGAIVLQDSYDASLAGFELTLENGASWTVTAESTLTKLVVGEGCSVSGTMTVDGVATEIVPGTYEGAIVIAPSGASGEASAASGEASASPSGEAS